MAGLSQEQQLPVQCLRDSSDNILLNAIAGSGKTYTITELARVAVAELGMNPDEVLSITLTSAAAANLRCRLYYHHKYTDTSHSLAATILADHGVISESSSLYTCDVGLLQFYEWLKARSPAARRFLASIKLVLCDEMQDSNELLVNILLLFKKGGSRIAAVGDDGQSVYGFQGSDVKWIRDFATMFAPCQTFSLSTSRRCSTHIMNLAEALLQNGRTQEYIAKPRGRSLEQERWDEEKIPLDKRISTSEKVKLLPCRNSFHAVEQACDAIRLRLDAQDSMVKRHEICVQSRSNRLLLQIKANLLKSG